MRVFCKNAFLVTMNADFERAFVKTAQKYNIEVQVEKSWKKIYTIDSGIVACDTKTIGDIASCYIDRVLLYAGKEEKIQEFVNMGVNNFLFDLEDKRQLALSLTRCTYRDISTKVWSQSDELRSVLSYAESPVFEGEHYYFDFTSGNYKYNGNDIYLSPAEEMVIAKWLLIGEKDKDKMSYISRLRSKLGKEFLSDINEDGTLKRSAKHV